MRKRFPSIIKLANNEASQLQHSSIGPEHLLLVVANQGETISAQILAENGVCYEALRKFVRVHFQSDGSHSGPLHKLLPPNQEAKKAIEHAIGEAQALGQKKVTVEHLLLGLLRMDSSRVAQMLDAFEVQRESIRNNLLHRMN